MGTVLGSSLRRVQDRGCRAPDSGLQEYHSNEAEQCLLHH